MDFEEHDDGYADHQERMQRAVGARGADPLGQLGHQARRVERCRRLEDDTDLPPRVVEDHYIVRRGLVGTAMPFVLLAMRAEITMQLLDMVFRDGKVPP